MRNLFRPRALVIVLLMSLLLPASLAVGQGGAEPGVLRNPLNYTGADPWLTYYDGNYYLSATTWTSEWTMRRSPTLAGLKTAEPVTIYTETEPSRCCNFWAPEFRLLDGPHGPHWYFYYTSGQPFGNYANQRIHVLESEGTDPLGPYTYIGRLIEPSGDRWLIDGSVLELNDALYFLFSAFGPLQSVYIAPMSDPWTLSGDGVLITAPEFPWEVSGGAVNEGPVALQHDGQTFITFSASSCATGDYKLGMLTYDGGDPLSPESWIKDPEPVFQRSDENGVYGPGHNGFFKSPDGTEDWIVYHAVDFPAGACNGLRTTRVQRVNWNEDGTPDFGIPVATDEPIAAPSGDEGIDPLPELPAREITRFRWYSLDGTYLRHANFKLRYDSARTSLPDSQFIIRPGLADPEAISIESLNFPGFYIRQSSNAILLTPDDFTGDFAADATWWVRPGLADETWISLESYARPGAYMSRLLGVTALVEITDSTPQTAREDGTFLEEH
jgi:GH43 family beta-xylosidase